MLPLSVTDLASGSSALLSDGGSAVDKREAIEQVAERVENDRLTFLKGRVTAFAVLWMVFLSDAALVEMLDDLVDPVSADFAMVRRSDNVPLQTQSYLYYLGANSQYLDICQCCHSRRVLLVGRRV